MGHVLTLQNLPTNATACPAILGAIALHSFCHALQIRVGMVADASIVMNLLQQTLNVFVGTDLLEINVKRNLVRSV